MAKIDEQTKIELNALVQSAKKLSGENKAQSLRRAAENSARKLSQRKESGFYASDDIEEEEESAGKCLLSKDAFFHSINVYKKSRHNSTQVLSRTDEAKLMRKAFSGDPQAKRQLALGNIDLVIWQARKLTKPNPDSEGSLKPGNTLKAGNDKGKTLDLLDLIQEGFIGLIRSIENNQVVEGENPKVNKQFATVAYKRIEGACKDAIRKSGSTIAMSARFLKELSMVRGIERKLIEQLQRTPTDDELAEASGLDAKRINRLFARDIKFVELDSPNEESEGRGIEQVEFSTSKDALDQLADQERCHYAMAALTTREREIIELRFGFCDGQFRTQQETADKLGVAEITVTLTELKAIRKMRNALKLDSYKLKNSADDNISATERGDFPEGQDRAWPSEDVKPYSEACKAEEMSAAAVAKADRVYWNAVSDAKAGKEIDLVLAWEKRNEALRVIRGLC